MSGEDLCYLSALELRRLYLKRELSPLEVTEAVLHRIEQSNPEINAFITPTPELALDQARSAESAYAKNEVLPLSGIPLSLKDLTVTRGIRTTRGSRLYENWIPEFDAPISARLQAAGAVLLGKTNTPEMGWKGDSSNRLMAPTQNPWKSGRTAGGSSGGAAAAVASGMGPLSQGTDGAGSIRIPSAFCGVFGLKPSWGLVPQYPASAVELLSHAGPITRTVRDAALMLDTMAGADALDRVSWPAEGSFLEALAGSGIAGLRVAWTPDLGYAAVDPEVREIAAAAAARFAELGCEVEEAQPSAADPWEMVHTIWSSAFAGVFLDNLDEVRDRLDPGLLAVVEQGRQFSAAELAAAYMRRNEYYHIWRVFMEKYDLVLTPALPVTAFAAGNDHPGHIAGRATTYLSWTAFTYPFNITGQPAASVPCGFAANGLPVGLQIVGRWRDDATVLRAAAAFEELAPWVDGRPLDPAGA
jgi:aspartyl-tRNA(Asn)/glutamyl-tRNA(Gln) amidotransferase subunit A